MGGFRGSWGGLWDALGALCVTPPPLGAPQDPTASMLADFIDCPPDDEHGPEPPP